MKQRKGKITHYSLLIPFSDLPLHQLLARKHGLTLSEIEIEGDKEITRVKCVLNGNSENLKSFDEDLHYSEMYEEDAPTRSAIGAIRCRSLRKGLWR